jgi:hypothetical protein
VTTLPGTARDLLSKSGKCAPHVMAPRRDHAGEQSPLKRMILFGRVLLLNRGLLRAGQHRPRKDMDSIFFDVMHSRDFFGSTGWSML